MKQVDRAEVICVIDRSGSMESIRRDAIGGFNAFLSEQKQQEGECRLTLVLFNDRVQVVHESVDLAKVRKLTMKSYVPSGSTALLDAVKFAITGARERLQVDPEHRPIGFKRDSSPPRVIVAILTDGEENSSRKATRSEVFELIQSCRDRYGWDFIFLAANQDAIQEGARLGIDSGQAVNFDATGAGVMEANRVMSCMVSEARRAPRRKARRAKGGSAG